MSSNKETILHSMAEASHYIADAISVLESIFGPRPPSMMHDDFGSFHTSPELKVIENLRAAYSTLRMEERNLEDQPSIDIEAYHDMLRTLPPPHKTEIVEHDDDYVGIFKISGPYSLFQTPEQTYHTQKFINDPMPPNVMTTGQVFKVRGRVMAVEIIISKEDNPKICWTHFHNLTPITEENVE